MAISPEQALELIKKLGLTRFLNNPEPPAHSAGDKSGAIYHGDEQLSSPIDRQFAHSPGGAGSSIDSQIMRSHMFNNFSPFAPDPSLYLESQKVPSSGSRSGKVSPITLSNTNSSGATASSARPNSASHSTQQRYSFYDAGRSSGRQDGLAQRASPTRKTPPRHEYDRNQTSDSIQDLNGTLASLDLDNQNRHGHQEWRHIVNSSRASPPS